MGDKTDSLMKGTTQGQDPEQIRASIAHTRAQMQGTIEELHGVLNPTVLKEQAVTAFHDAKDRIKNELRDELDQARASVHDATIGRVQHMVHNAQDKVRRGGQSLTDNIKANPVPAALIGSGLLWIFINARRGRARRQESRWQGRNLSEGWRRGESEGRRRGERFEREPYGAEEGWSEGFLAEEAPIEAGPIGGMRSDVRADEGGYMGDEAEQIREKLDEKAGQIREKFDEKAGQARERVGEFAQNARERIGSFARDTRETARGAGRRARQIAHRARERAGEVESRAEEIFQTNPLAVGAAMLAIGTGLGLLLPRTGREDRLFGQRRDSLMARAGEAAQDAIERVGEKASELRDDLVEGDRPEETLPH